MSSTFSKFKPLLVSAAIGIMVCLISKYIFDGTRLVSIFSGLIVFCITAIVYIYFKQALVLRRVENLHQGIMSYEKQINKRLHGLTTNIPTKHDFDHLEQDMQRMKFKSTTSAAQSITSSTPHGVDDTYADDNKVVELHPKKKEETNSDQHSSDVDLSKKATVRNRLIKGLKIQLQPAVSLDTKEIYSFNALPCLPDDQGEVLNSMELKTTFSDDTQQRLISQLTLDQTISLVRMLRRQKKSPLLFVELLACTLNNKRAFDAFTGALQAHHQVKKNIIIEIPQYDFMTLTKVGLAKLRLILNLGYSLALSNVSDIDAAKLALTTDLFRHIKLTFGSLEELKTLGNSTQELEIVTQCRKEKIKIIVAGIENEHQVIHLIDNHLEIAEGNFFSEPKFPSKDTSEKAAAGEK